jgi:hypothetical protein
LAWGVPQVNELIVPGRYLVLYLDNINLKMRIFGKRELNNPELSLPGGILGGDFRSTISTVLMVSSK